MTDSNVSWFVYVNSNIFLAGFDLDKQIEETVSTNAKTEETSLSNVKNNIFFAAQK